MIYLPAYILVIQAVVHGELVDYRHEVYRHGSLNLQRCLEFRNAVRTRILQNGGEIIYIDCEVSG